MEYFVILYYPFSTGIAVPNKYERSDIMSMFDDVTVEVECPTCNKEISISLD